MFAVGAGGEPVGADCAGGFAVDAWGAVGDLVVAYGATDSLDDSDFLAGLQDWRCCGAFAVACVDEFRAGIAAVHRFGHGATR
ncbi:hypothetical protein MAHJHV61_47660 [Mycobacterium avium subsp. hominissuis]